MLAAKALHVKVLDENTKVGVSCNANLRPFGVLLSFEDHKQLGTSRRNL
jgi:hypothetical protein